MLCETVASLYGELFQVLDGLFEWVDRGMLDKDPNKKKSDHPEFEEYWTFNPKLDVNNQPSPFSYIGELESNARLLISTLDDLLKRVAQMNATPAATPNTGAMVLPQAGKPKKKTSSGDDEKTYKLLDFIRLCCEPTDYPKSIKDRIHRLAKNGKITMPTPVNKKTGERITNIYRKNDLIEVWPEIKKVLLNLPNVK